MKNDNWEEFMAMHKSTYIVPTHILQPCQTTNEAEKCFVVCQKGKEMYLQPGLHTSRGIKVNFTGALIPLLTFPSHRPISRWAVHCKEHC